MQHQKMNNLGVLNIVLNLDKICRVCLKEQKDLTDISQNETIKMFSFCTTIKIEEDDELPQMLCPKCLEQIKQFYAFKKCCLEVDKLLRQYLMEMKTQEIKQEILENVKLSQELAVIGVDTVNAEIEQLTFQEPNQLEIVDLNSLGTQSSKNNVPGVELDPLRDEILIPLEIDEIKIDTPQDDELNTTIQLQETLNDFNNKMSKKDEKFYCKFCNKSFEKESYLGKHLQRHPEYQEDCYKCPKCKMEFRSAKELQVHSKRHESAQIVVAKCPKCNMAFSSLDEVEAHVGEHVADGDVTCTICHKTFGGTGILRQHFRTHFKDRPYCCDDCGQTFTAPSCFRMHMKRHNDDFSHICKICDKGFLQKRYLQRHMRTHTKEKICFCHVCNKGFSENSDLNVHMRIHNGEIPYKCAICEKPCKTSSQLHVHLKIHSDEKPYVCKICNKGFKIPNGLKKHILVHPGETPYACAICGIKFTKSLHLKQHELKHSRASRKRKTH